MGTLELEPACRGSATNREGAVSRALSQRALLVASFYVQAALVMSAAGPSL